MGALSVIPESFAKVAAYQAEHYAALDNMEEFNRSAKMEDANAAAALRRGAMQAGLLRSRGTQVAAAQRVAFAANNVDATSGSAADAQASSEMLSELDAETARNNARAQALGHQTSARRYRKEFDKLNERHGIDGTAGKELMADLYLSALGAVASFGMGGK